MDKVSETVKRWLQALSAKFIYTHAKGKYEARNSRIVDFLALKKTDQVPEIPNFRMLPAMDKGPTVQAVTYCSGNTYCFKLFIGIR